MHFLFKSSFRSFLLVSFLLLAGAAQAQNQAQDDEGKEGPEIEVPGKEFIALDAYYLEIGNNSDVYSINYDRIVYTRDIFKAAVRIGLGTNIFFQENEPGVYPVVPVEAIGMFGRYEKHLELGLGYTRRFTDEPDLLQNMYFGRVGFRYQKPNGGLLVRVGVTPFISPENKSSSSGLAVVPRFGLSIGRSF